MKVVISGAGIAGLALANRLSTLGAEVVLLERATVPRSHGYMMDFFGPGYDAIESMGLLPAIQDVAYDIAEATFVDERGRRRAGVRPRQFANGPLLNLMRPDLERVLRENLSPDVDLRFGTSPSAVTHHRDGVRVELEDGTRLDADLLVGADGIHSTVRSLVFGNEARYLRYLGFHTTAFCFDAPEIHALLQDRACLTDTVDRQMGFYALRDGRVATFGVRRTPDPTLPEDIRAAVVNAFAGLGWVTPAALDQCPPPKEIYYDQVAQIEMPQWSRGRVVLVGDACHAVSLLAGQGASLGIAGAYLLADRLAHAPIDQALVQYEQLWRPVAQEKQKVGRAGARWFLPESRWQLRIRRATLNLARLPVVDRYVASILAGKPHALFRSPRQADGPFRPSGVPPTPLLSGRQRSDGLDSD